MARKIRIPRPRFGAVRSAVRSAVWSAIWSGLWESVAPACGYAGCAHSASAWGRMRRRSRGVRMLGSRYCRSECLERALGEVLRRTRFASRDAGRVSHRIPLGLLLLSRQQLTAEQLQAGLEAQRRAMTPVKIGACLQRLGFATEREITAALARQWSCPLLRSNAAGLSADRSPQIPMPLLEFFRMIPVALVEATGKLLMAFSEGIDYTALYAIEQMLGYRTEACLVCPSVLQKSLEDLSRRRGAGDVVIEHVEDTGECARIVGNYSAKVGAEEVRFARCGEHLWIRLTRRRRETLNLVLRVTGS